MVRPCGELSSVFDMVAGQTTNALGRGLSMVMDDTQVLKLVSVTWYDSSEIWSRPKHFSGNDSRRVLRDGMQVSALTYSQLKKKKKKKKKAIARKDVIQGNCT